jgi:hypothetical protein
MSCSHIEVVSRFRETLTSPARQRLAEFMCTCGACVGWEEARALYFALLEQDKHTRREAGGVYPGDLDVRLHTSSR